MRPSSWRAHYCSPCSPEHPTLQLPHSSTVDYSWQCTILGVVPSTGIGLPHPPLQIHIAPWRTGWTLSNRIRCWLSHATRIVLAAFNEQVVQWGSYWMPTSCMNNPEQFGTFFACFRQHYHHIQLKIPWCVIQPSHIQHITDPGNPSSGLAD